MKHLHTVCTGFLHSFRQQLPIALALLMSFSATGLFAEANYVYHEQTTSNPGCGPNYMSTTSPTNAASVQLGWKIEYQFYTTNTVVYYTTDGSTPSGAFGIPSGTTQAIAGSYNCTFGAAVDVATATIPVQPAGTTVRYIIGAWHSGGGDEIFANGPGAPCACGTPTNNSSLATVFSYTVTRVNNIEVVSSGGTTFATYSTIASAVTAINGGTHTGTITASVYQGHSETAPVGGIALTATGTLANPITIQKTGVGANPVINAFVGTSTPGSANQDGIFRLVGSDYVTINGIDLNDANVANPATMEYGYGLFKVSATDGCQNNTIQNCTITLNRINNAAGAGPSVEGSKGINVVNSTALAQTTALTVTTSGGANSNNKFYTNTIQNCNYGIVLIGYADISPFTNADQNNDVGGASALTGNTIRNYGGAAAATNPSAGVRTLAQYGLNVSYNTINNNDGGGVNHVSTLRGIYINTATSASSTISNNTITVKSGATTSQVSLIENVSGSTAAGNTVNITNNTFTNCAYTTQTTGVIYGIYNNTATPANLNISNNTFNPITLNAVTGSGGVNLIYVNATIGTLTTISNNTFTNQSLNTTGTVYMIYNSNSTQNYLVDGNSISGTFAKTGAGGTVYGFYNFGSPSGGTATVTNNNFSNITLTGATAFYGIYQATSTTQIEKINSNTISNITSGASTLIGIHHNYGAAGSECMNNSVYGITGGAVVTGIQMGNTTASLGLTSTGNTVYTLSSTGASAVTGMYHYSGASTNLYKNKIYDISVSNASGTVNGLLIQGGVTVNVYNNLIGDLRAPLSNLADAVRGISITSTASSSTLNISYNSIYLAATSSGATFGTSGIYHTTNATATTAMLNLRNNIIVNNSTPNGTGIAAAYRRSSTTLTNYGSVSNNNLFYAGTPSANNVIFYDGTTGQQTLANYQALAGLAPRDNASVTENPVFVSVTGSDPTFLHFAAATSTLAESGGANIAGITADYDADVRQGNLGYAGTGIYPDLGADEFEGTNPSLFPLDAGATVLIDPWDGVTCFENDVVITVAIKNYGYQSIDFTVNPVTVTTVITGPLGATLNATVNTGALAAGASMNVVMTGTHDMTAPGVYAFNASTSLTGDGNVANDAMLEATRTAQNPTVVLTSNTPVCEDDPIILTATSTGGNLDNTFLNSNITPVPIPDNSLVGGSSTISITSPAATVSGTTKLKVDLDITTTYNGDLDAYLIGPGGCGTIELATDNGSGSDGIDISLYNYGAYSSITTIPTGAGLVTGNYMMEGNSGASPAINSGTGGVNYPSVVYSPLNGCPVNGVWTLFVGDDAGGDIPTLNNWALTITQPGVGNYVSSFSGAGTFGTIVYSGPNNSIATVEVTGVTPGAYNYDVYASDASGCISGVSSTSVTVSANTTYYADADGDSYGDPLVTIAACDGAPVGFVSDNTDCVDANAFINPGATEVCDNAVDDDCDGFIDEDCATYTYYADTDEDTYGDALNSIVSASPTPPAGYVVDDQDCDDSDPAINPGATEICNAIDEDCDGTADDGLVFDTWYADADDDGYGNAAVSASTCDGAPAGYVGDDSDCDDSDAAINPGATEICNAIDDDCDGIADDGLTFLDYYTDNDGDSYGDYLASPVNSCSPVAGSVTNNEDCNDSNNLVNPDGTEICNGVDDDCDGTVDDGIIYEFSYGDGDDDGYGDPLVIISTCDGPPAGYVSNDDDCDDDNAAINPGATEICNAIDDDCDGTADDGLTFTTYYSDNDGDGYGNATYGTTSTCDGITPVGYSTTNDDCNPLNAAINPGATEICNGIDDDCDASTDEGLVFDTWYADADGDGYGNAAVSTSTCDGAPAGYVGDDSDCDDGSAAINPGATEICNDIDDDCDGTPDDGLVFDTWYADGDDDGYGNAAVSTSTCDGAPAGYVGDDSDCDDSDAAINPGATEICNGIDDDCDASTDEGLVFDTWYADADDDGYGNAAVSTSTCDGAPSGYVADNTDCHDGNAAINPGATEICNGVDDNCDGNTDDGLITAVITAGGPTTFCQGESVLLSANTGEGYTYQWKVGGSNIPGATSSTLNANKSGSITVVITIPGGCSDVSDPVITTRLARPVSNVINADATNDLCFDASIKLKANLTTGVTYQWWRGGLLLAGETNYLYFATTPGNYRIQQTSTATGCYSVSPPYSIIQTCRDGELVNSDAVENSISVYPNPAENEFTIEVTIATSENEALIGLYNLMGDLVYTGTAVIENGAINEHIVLSDAIASGLYVVKITSGSTELTSQVLIQK